MSMTYVETIEPRLTPMRRVSPATTPDVLIEWCRDLTEEIAERLRLVDNSDLSWQPHPDANSAGVTVWHVARWLDILGSRAFTGKPAVVDAWHHHGWRDATGYEPDGIGYLGFGALTGYTPEEMRAVPTLDAVSLSTYLAQSGDRLISALNAVGDDITKSGTGILTPYQQVSMTIQGSFGHVGEIDALVSLHARLATAG